MHRLLAAIAFLCVPAVAIAQTPSKPSVEGAWKVVEIVTTGANASTNSSPQPGLYLFTKNHYSIVLVQGPNGRKGNPLLPDPTKATDADKLARYDEWSPFTANSGTYEIKGMTLTTRPLVAKNATVVTNSQGFTSEFKFEGNTLTLTQKSQNGPWGLEGRIKLVRAE